MSAGTGWGYNFWVGTEGSQLVYGKSDYFFERSFDVFISRLRKMLRDDPSVSIENVFKVGFILNVPEATSTATYSK